jgi:hypothetical protein
MSSVVISGDTSGAVTLAVPTVAGTNTATLPAATGTVMVSGNMPAFSAYTSANQSITTTTYTKIACNTKVFDTNTNYDATTNYRFTPTVAGYYQLNLNLQLGFATLTRTISILYKNGSAFNYGVDFSGSSLASCTTTYLVYANGTTDYFEMYTFLVGTSLLSVGGATGTNFSGVLVRSA